MNKTLIKILPFAGLALGAVTDLVIPDSELQPPADHPYFLYFLGLLAVVYGILFIASFISAKLDEKISYKAPLIAGTAVLITVINLITSKYALLPVLFFPCLDRVFGVFATDYELLIQCILASGQLLLRGFLAGGILGFLTGILIGFNKKASYWISPFMKFVGPIPPTSWSPLVLSLFTTTYSASVFMVALAVWFPITLMTSSGIQNVNNSYFEVASTLGSGKLNRIFKVAVPAAMPSIFLGIFYATCSAFVTLVTADLIAVICTLVITLVFKIKDQVLVWQRGVIKW